MQNKKNPTTLNLDIPTPNVTKISKVAIGFIIIVLISLFVIGLITLKSQQHSVIEDPQEHDAAPTQEDTSWYKNKSNSMAKTLANNAPSTDNKSASNASSQNQELEKLKQATYLEAINSPLETANDISTQDVGSPVISQPTPVINSADNLDSGLRKLPITEDQAAKLSKVFGLSVAPTEANTQSEKNHFLNSQASPDKDYLSEPLKHPVSPFELQAGSILPASVAEGLNSDLPGQVTAIVDHNVYDSVSGKYLLIPQGSKLTIIYDSNIAYGQERILPAVKRVTFPNGDFMDLNGMPAADKTGEAGFSDIVDNHYSRLYGQAVVVGGLSAAFQLSQPKQSNSSFVNPTNAQIAAGAMGQQMAQVTAMTVGKNLDLQPTLRIRVGYHFNVKITSDMVFPRPYVG